MNILLGDLAHGFVPPTADPASEREQGSFPASEPDIESAQAGPEEDPVPFSMHKMLSTNDLGSAAASHGRWLWSGYLAPGALTLLSSQWKTGKTTLLSVLLAKLNTGGTLAGLPVTPGKAVVVSEEPPVLWYERSKYLNFGDHIRWLCRPFKTKPTMEQWLSFINYLAALHRQEARNLVVIDTLAKLLPAKCESSADAMLAALMPLQQLTDRGLSVLLLHHATKKDCLPGLAARGSGALPSHVDILLELRWYGSPTDDNRRRRLIGFSRYALTPRELVIEWTADGTDYVSLGPNDLDNFTEQWQVLKTVFEDADHKLTRREILQQWPADFPKPNDVTLFRWLRRAVASADVCQEGEGRCRAPFRYWLPQRTDDFVHSAVGGADFLSWPEQQRRDLELVQKASDEFMARLRAKCGSHPGWRPAP
jgi:hypothetical protein